MVKRIASIILFLNYENIIKYNIIIFLLPYVRLQKHTLYAYTIVFFDPERSGAKNIPLFKYNKKEYKEKSLKFISKFESI